MVMLLVCKKSDDIDIDSLASCLGRITHLEKFFHSKSCSFSALATLFDPSKGHCWITNKSRVHTDLDTSVPGNLGKDV